MEDNRVGRFSLGGMAFEYDDNKNQINIKKHGISFKSAARIFFDYDRIEFYDEDHSYDEDRYNTIGDTSAGRISQKAEGALIGNIDQFIGNHGLHQRKKVTAAIKGRQLCRQVDHTGSRFCHI